jgi:23S rRNA (cytidine1920-2'-O)/16S rRNA (cytidine1409-2'-O)-methyltransferase
LPKTRLDHLLVARGLAESRAKAQALLMAGAVRVNGQIQTKSGLMVDEGSNVHITHPLPYASRGGYKLAHALDTFGLSPEGLIALDVGASTGGFTDVLLQRGASFVYAVDVGYGLIDWRLRQDQRVVLLERTNIRHLPALPPLPQEQPTPAPPPHSSSESKGECATIDVSFISLRLVLPAVQRLVHPSAWIVALIKPQFEAGPEDVGKGGVIRDAAIHASVLYEVLQTASELGLKTCHLTRSPITGPAGNVEFLAWLTATGHAIDIAPAIESVTSLAVKSRI